jgi:hypothetical protein
MIVNVQHRSLVETFCSIPVSNRSSLNAGKGSCSMGLLSDPPTAPVSHRSIRSLLLPAGLLVAACVSALSFPMPYGHTLSWTRLLGLVVEEICTVSIVCVVTVVVLSPAIQHKNQSEFLGLVQLASVTALWLAPFVLLVRENSLLTLPIAAILAVIVTNSLESKHARDSGSDLLLISIMIDPIPLVPMSRLQKSVLAAMLVEIGALAALGGHPVAGAFLIAVSFAVWTWNYGHLRSDSSEVSNANPLLTLSLVSLLMIVALFPYLQRGSGYGATSAHRGLFPHRPSGGNSKQLRPSTAAQIQGGHPGSGGDQGIILWGEIRNYTKLVAPAPVLANALNRNGDANPLKIPFDGVYWFFKSPDAQPPTDSRQAHTTPDLVEIHSTDRRPLLIEAHDHLANLIELNCCSRIQIAIRNADRYPETVVLELVLVNTTLPHSPSVSLGRMMVNSTRPWKVYEKPVTVEETLNFPIPPSRSLRAFDEVKIVFLLDRARADAGARIAIDHFVLVPRGL